MYDAAFRKRHFLFFDTADLYESLFARVPLPLVDYSWILENLTSSHGYDVTKRIVDMVSAIVLSPIFLCLSPLVALAIKLDDGGAIFISQERIGRFQQPIKIWKFRSMSGNDNGVYGGNGATQLTVTRVGKVIRALRIDELPQLWNLFKGDLSLVGPRPELPTLAAHYSARIPFYNARHLVKPGLTGWAQL
jgi:lipopolysaccharide/colanic/teichoic acid biosynthesis glycosyltransferase